MKTLKNHIFSKISNYNRGKIFFPEHFRKFGKENTVHQALLRIANEGHLVRLGHGIYLYPIKDPQLGVIHPSIDGIARAIAKRDRARIIPTGAMALSKLGLTTQVPMNAVYLTDGSPRSIQIGNRKIKFKRTVPKNVAVKGEISGLVIQALREIGKDKITEEQLETIRNLLKKEIPGNLAYDARMAPAWIRDIMFDAMEEA